MKIHEVTKLGQQIWLDNLSRSLIVSGELTERLSSGISGVTSNPFIFHKSIENDTLYNEEIACLKTKDLTPKERYEHLVIKDIQDACDIFLPLYQDSKGDKGYVSLEVTPDLAHDIKGTVEEGKRLWTSINRPNLMIKVPATPEGLIAITELISLGVNINVTLIFSRQVAYKTFEAYAAGLNTRRTKGESIKHIRLVSSFFMSRIDSAIDPKLPNSLQGKGAIAIAKLAYLDWQQFCELPIFIQLQEFGALKPSLLWASTGTKNHSYSDVMYIDHLIGANTVNTVPEKTLTAFLDHGTIEEMLTQNINQAHDIMSKIDDLNISLDVIAEQLQKEGLVQFEQAFDALLALLV